jgi:hypothetical protein
LSRHESHRRCSRSPRHRRELLIPLRLRRRSGPATPHRFHRIRRTCRDAPVDNPDAPMTFGDHDGTCQG